MYYLPTPLNAPENYTPCSLLYHACYFTGEAESSFYLLTEEEISGFNKALIRKKVKKNSSERYEAGLFQMLEISFEYV